MSSELKFQKTVLSNGVRVVTESHRHTRAVSLGLFVEFGTRHEDPRLGGITHFLEHLVFKGTRRRSAFELARALEAVGGDLNAFTTHEYTCFHALALAEHMDLALDVLSDLATGARLTAADFVKEREVILQEIQMAKDSVEEHIVETFVQMSYAGTSLGTPIAGTEETLAAMGARDLREHYARMIVGPKLVLSVAGPIEHADVVTRAERWLGKIPGRVFAAGGKAKRQARASAPNKPNRKTSQNTRLLHPKRIEEFISRPSEQVHLLVGFESSPYLSDRRFESFVVNELVGGGPTSRLYQAIREERGLVYTVYSFLQAFQDTGLFMAYAGTSAKNAGKVLRSLKAEFKKVRDRGLRASELKQFKTQIKGQILLGAEDVDNRMNSLGVNEMIFGAYRPVEAVIQEIENVTLDSLGDYVRKYFDLDRVSLMVMGDVPEKDALKLFRLWE